MYKKSLVAVVSVLSVFTASSQQKEGRENIKDLCGCFAVTFNYAETFTNDTTKKFFAHKMDNFAVNEYAYPIEESDTRVVIQHLLVIPDGKGTVIKHWREDWQYEQTLQWQYTNAQEWIKTTLSQDAVKGKWTQSVWEVTDAPRYTGTSEWVHANNQTFWLSTTDAPLPRREYTTRKDYNIMQRTNRIIVTPQGYLHEQDNKKIIRKAGVPDSLQAEEKGYNHYARVPESRCASAKAFWTTERAAFWKDVKALWDEKMSSGTKITLKTKADGTVLYEALDDVENKTLTLPEKKKAVSDLLDKYLTLSQ